MNIDFDPNTDVTHLIKHGVFLSLANDVDGGAALVWLDDRFADDEKRMTALVPLTKTP